MFPGSWGYSWIELSFRRSRKGTLGAVFVPGAPRQSWINLQGQMSLTMRYSWVASTHHPPTPSPNLIPHLVGQVTVAFIMSLLNMGCTNNHPNSILGSINKMNPSICVNSQTSMIVLSPIIPISSRTGPVFLHYLVIFLMLMVDLTPLLNLSTLVDPRVDLILNPIIIPTKMNPVDPVKLCPSPLLAPTMGKPIITTMRGLNILTPSRT